MYHPKMVGYPGARGDARAAGRLARHGGAILWDLLLWVVLIALTASIVVPIGYVIFT